MPVALVTKPFVFASAGKKQCGARSSDDSSYKIRKTVEKNLGKFVKEYNDKRNDRLNLWKEKTSEFMSTEIENTTTFHNELVNTITELRRQLEDEQNQKTIETIDIDSYKNENDAFFENREE